MKVELKTIIMKRLIFLLAMTVLPLGLFAQWSDEGGQGAVLVDANYYSHEIAQLEDGSFYLAFNAPTETNSINYYLAYFDKDGNALWDDPKLLSDNPTLSFTKVNRILFADRDGNALVVACHTANSITGYEESYTVYKVDKEGNSLWGESGVDLMRGEAREVLASMSIAQLTDGSYVFAWSELVPGTESDLRIRMQRWDKDGKALWTEDRILTEEGLSYAYPYLEEVGNNEFILVYAKGSAPEIMARKYDFDGNDVWAEPTLVYGLGGFSGIPLWTIMSVEPADGGVLVAWHDDRYASGRESVFIAYIKGDGTHGFTSASEGLEIEYSDLRCFNPSAVFDKENQKIFVVFRETSETQSWQCIKTQLVDLTGELLWDVKGVEVCPMEQISVGYQSAQLGPKGTYASFFMRNPDPYKDVRAYACLQAADASFVWQDSTVRFGDYAVDKSDMMSTPLCQDQWICVWKEDKQVEEGEESSYLIVGQNIRVDGSLGSDPVSSNSVSPSVPFSLSVYPNPVDMSAKISIEGAGFSSVEVDLTDLQGRVVDRVYSGRIPSGRILLEWTPPAGLASGLYILRMSQDGSVGYRKIVLK